MPFEERLAAIKAKQAAAEKSKKDEAERATFAEKEKKHSELALERERVSAELISTQAESQEADAAMAEAEAFASEQGDNLDPEVKAEIDSLKEETNAVKKKFEALKAEVARIDAELATFGGGETAPTETVIEEATEEKAVETSVESTLEAPDATEAKAKAEEEPKMTMEEAEKILNNPKLSADDIDQVQKAWTTILKERHPGQSANFDGLQISRDGGFEGPYDNAKKILISNDQACENLLNLYLKNGVPKITDVQEEILKENPDLIDNKEKLKNLAVGEMLKYIKEAKSIAYEIGEKKPELVKPLADQIFNGYIGILKNFNQGDLKEKDKDTISLPLHYALDVRSLVDYGGDPQELINEARLFSEKHRSELIGKIASIVEDASREDRDVLGIRSRLKAAKEN